MHAEKDFSELRDVLLISGGGFFSAMADWLGTQMGADLAIIGSLKISEAEYIEVLGWSAKKPGKRLVNYDACRGPCMNVIERNDTVLYHGELDELFPEDSLVQERGSKSYLGLPLKNRNGEVIGLLSLLWTEQLAPDEARDHVDALKPLINRIEAELVEHNISHAFGAFMNPIADDPRLPDKAIFRTIVQQAASIAQVHSAILTRCVDRDAQNFQILAAVAGGELLFESEDTLLPYEDTPCGNLRTCDVFFQGSGLQETFPHVELFRTLGVHAYCGFGIRERDGTPIGHLSLLHTRPIARRMLECRIVNVVASRARQELQRFAVEKEREDLRDALNVRKKLESLGLMAGTIAHDFNNQLAAIIGNTELAKIELETNHPARPYIDEAETSMWRARDVIGEMMDFAGNFPKTPITTIDLNDVVARVITGMEPDLPESIETELILHEPMPPITGRTMQLHRVITNIAINAVDSLRGRSGRVTVGLSLSKVSRAEQDRCLTGFCKAITGDAIKLEIRDNGPGMDVEAAEKAFDPFFSSKGVTRGLGLSGALGVARRFPMGLTFDSTPGVGTSFCLYFQPADTDASGHVKTPMERASSLGTILVLDDQSEVLATVAKLVRTLGFAVIEASSGEDAIEVAKASRRIDAALIDVVMPGMDGWTTLQNLREALPGLPAAMMTGYSDASLTKQRAIDLDLDLEVLQKPFNREALEQAISNLVKGIALSARVGAE